MHHDHSHDTVDTFAESLEEPGTALSFTEYGILHQYRNVTMSSLIDAEAGTERFGGYEAELKLVQADLNQQLEQIKETTGEPRKAAISRAERALEEAEELVRRRLDAQ
jgi:hypothetical protein